MNTREDELLSEIIEVVASISEVESKLITIDGLLQNWGVDSMKGLEIMYALEKKYKVHMQEQDLLQMKTVKSIYDLIKKKLS